MNSFRVYRSYYETFDPFPGKHVDPLLRYSCLALRAAPKIATVAMLWRFVQALPNQMIETTTDRNFLAWKRSHVIQRLRKKTWASWARNWLGMPNNPRPHRECDVHSQGREMGRESKHLGHRTSKWNLAACVRLDLIFWAHPSVIL